MTVKSTINDVREFWDSRPCNIRHSNAQVGTKEFFDEVEKKRYFVEPHIPKFADFSTWNNKRVLEIGCGIGTEAINFVRNGAIYTGIELSKESLLITKKRLEIFDLRGSLLEGNVEKLDEVLPEQTFDLIYSFGVLHHTPNLRNSLIQISRYMNQSSILKMMVYASNSYKQVMINGGLDQPEAQYGCPIANSYTKEEISDILISCGFEVNEIRQAHIFPYEVESYKRHVYRKVPWFEHMDPEVFKLLEQNFGWHLLVSSRLA